MLVVITALLSVLGEWIYFCELFLLIFLKLFTSFRLYPLFSNIRIDGAHVYKEYYGFCAKTLPLSQVYLYETKFHGLHYIIFAPNIIKSVHWRDIAKNRQAIIYPVCRNMRSDFPELFKQAEIM